jgi:hypothetical protein
MSRAETFSNAPPALDDRLLMSRALVFRPSGTAMGHFSYSMNLFDDYSKCPTHQVTKLELLNPGGGKPCSLWWCCLEAWRLLQGRVARVESKPATVVPNPGGVLLLIERSGLRSLEAKIAGAVEVTTHTCTRRDNCTYED